MWHSLCLTFMGVPQISQIYTDGHTVCAGFHGWVFHADFADYQRNNLCLSVSSVGKEYSHADFADFADNSVRLKSASGSEVGQRDTFS